MSTHRTDAIQISRRYATAIFDLATEAKKEATIVAEINTLAAAIESDAALSEALSSPLISNAKKTEIVAALIAKADTMTQSAANTIAEGGRADVIPTIAHLLTAMLRERQNEVTAIVTSARPLAASTQKQLSQSLTKATGKNVQITLKEDPYVLGGLLIELGSVRLDATLSGALTSMRKQLLATTH